ncbi:DUF2827 family protein [Hydrogenophaga sp.]|uniref:DUF2827 family protein n=1 Tax=Hydrogenophaga sp. TaxID=1904254 RepID=UPI003F71A39B
MIQAPRFTKAHLRIGITIGLHSENEDLWINGIKQNALALASLLNSSPRGHDVCLLNTTAVSLDAGLAWNRSEFPTFPLEDKVDEIDVLIALGGAVSSDTVKRVRSRGGRVVVYKCGVEYIMSMQATLFNRSMKGRPDYPEGFDEIWAIPQVIRSSGPFWSVLYRRPVRCVPFVWDPRWIEAQAASLPGHGLRDERTGPLRISVFEPNHDVVKFCLYPLMIAELVWREHPELIEFVSVTNTEHLRTNPEFLGVVEHLDLVRQHRAFFENRFTTPWFLAHHTDVVVSHQWENPLNYAYLECSWLGYPLVHNGSLAADLGFAYEGFDLEAGARQLIQALRQDHLSAYRERQRSRIARYLCNHPGNVGAYDQLLDGLFDKKAPSAVKEEHAC